MARDGDIKDKNVRCSFCNKSQNDVKTLIAGPGVYICNECVALCREIVEEETDKIAGKSDNDFAIIIGLDIWKNHNPLQSLFSSAQHRQISYHLCG